MKINRLISVITENKGVKKIYGNLIYNHKIDPTKIITSVNQNGQSEIDLNILFPQNHKIKKIFLLEMDDFYFLLGHYKEDKMIYNISFSNILLSINNNDFQKGPLINKKSTKNFLIDNINFLLDKINRTGISSLNSDEKKKLYFLSRKIE